MVRVALDALQNRHLNVEVTGAGPAVLALHGFTGNLSQWEPFSGAVGGEYKLVTVDLPGHGASDAPDNPELYDLPHTVRALAEVLDRLGIPRVHWLGYSLGGRIALGAAVMLPDRTLSLTAVSASPGLATAGERAARRESDEALAQRLEKQGIAAFVDYWESLPLWKSQSRLPLAAREKLRAQRLANNPAGLANCLRGIGAGSQPPRHRGLQKINVPALLVAGEEDDKYVAIAGEMQRLIPGSRLGIIRESGHAVHLEQPGQFNRAVRGFLRAADASWESITGTRSQPGR